MASQVRHWSWWAVTCKIGSRVKLDGIYSDWEPMKAKVPQGSLLGPSLFNNYINDLNLQVTNTSLQLYANDTTEYASDASPPVLEYIINSDLHILSTWLQQNYLHINASKTQAVTIGPVPYRSNLSVDNIQQSVKKCDLGKLYQVCLSYGRNSWLPGVDAFWSRVERTKEKRIGRGRIKEGKGEWPLSKGGEWLRMRGAKRRTLCQRVPPQQHC